MTSLEFFNKQTLADQGLASRARIDKIENIIATIYESDKDETSYRSLKKEGILRLAQEYEKIMLEKQQPEFINEICSLICKRFIDDGREWIARDAMEVLDNKYKRRSHQVRLGQKQSSSRSTPGPGTDLPVECSIMAKDIIGWLVHFNESDPEQVDHGTHQQILDLLYDATQKEEQYCDDNHIARHNIHDQKTSFDEANDAADAKFDTKITKPNALIARAAAIQMVDQEAYEKTIAFADYLKVWAGKQMNRYPSHTVQQAIRWRDAFEAAIKIIKQYLDDKARRTIKQWAKINSNMAVHGGTAASSMSAMPVYVPDTACEQLIDPKTMEPVYRTITKEQIDARGPKYAMDIDFIIRQVIFMDVIEERYVQIECGFGEWRAWAANEKLSRSA